MHGLLFCLGLYFLPAIIAAARHTHNSGGILLLNLFLGWTFIGWCVALVMALSSAPRWYYDQYRGYYRGW
jgi:Superinfection immunity protein